jgi:rhamnosyltransferase
MKEYKPGSVGVAIITHFAENHIAHCLPPLIASPLKARILVVNSSSGDGTIESAKEFGVETLVIPRAEFNHGLTREKARRHLNTEVVVMMTPDAYAVNEHLLAKLVEPLLNQRSSISYARQIPHKGAAFFESFSRSFNYPRTSHVRGIKDLPDYGIYLFFCSNSCAAYRNAALDEIGGFQSVLLGEDTLAVAALLKAGHKIAYIAEAAVHHSHNYTLKQEFQRHFDTGFARQQYRKSISYGGIDEKRGAHYAAALFKKVLCEKPYLLPYAFLQTFVKWLGYTIGKNSSNLPVKILQLLSSQDFYWTSDE